MKPGWVYYALSATPTEQRIKVGFTSNLRQRMVTMRRETFSRGRQPAIVLGVEPGTLALESERHRRFDTLRLSTAEWFAYGEELRDHIAQLDPYEIDRAFWPAPQHQPVPGQPDF